MSKVLGKFLMGNVGFDEKSNPKFLFIRNVCECKLMF